MTAVERLWAVVSKPRWSDDRIVSYRIDRLAWMLWLVGLVLWAVGIYAALVGPVPVLLAALAGFGAVHVASNLRLRHVVRSLEMPGAEGELAAAQGCTGAGVRLLRHWLEFGARRCDVKARKLEARAAGKAGSYRAARAAYHLRVQAHHERDWAEEARNAAEHHL